MHDAATSLMRAGSERAGVPDALSPIGQPFLSRVSASRAWSRIAFQSSRLGVAVALAAAPPALLTLAVLAGPPVVAVAIADPAGVRDLFARLLTAVATASSIAVSVATFTFGREVRGLKSIRDHYTTNIAFRERLREATGRSTMPLALGPALADVFAHVADAARRVRDVADADVRVDGVTLAAYAEVVREQAARARDAVTEAPLHPSLVLLAALDFEEEETSRFARRFLRHPEITGDAHAALETLARSLEDAVVSTFYAKTLDLEWGLSRMSMTILVTAFPSLATAALMVLGYGRELVAAVGPTGGALIVALAVAITFLPLAVFVSYVLRFVFINQYTLPTAGFVLGPEEPEAVRLGPREG